jgi:acyl-CoA thioesterase
MVGVTFSKIEKGGSQAVLDVTDKLLNSMGVLHGGATYTLVDCGMGAALYSRLGEGKKGRTLEIKIAYLKAVTSGTVTCDTKVIHLSKTVATLESDVRQDGDLIAKAIGTFSIFEGDRDRT